MVLELLLKNVKIMYALLRPQTPPLRCVSQYGNRFPLNLFNDGQPISCQQLLKLTLLSTTNFSVYRFCTNYYPANRRSWGQITCGSVFCCGASTDQLLRCFALFFLIRCRNDKRNRSKVLAEILGKTEGGLNLKLVGVSPTTVIDLGPPPDARLSGSLAAEIRYGPCKG